MNNIYNRLPLTIIKMYSKMCKAFRTGIDKTTRQRQLCSVPYHLCTSSAYVGSIGYSIKLFFYWSYYDEKVKIWNKTCLIVILIILAYRAVYFFYNIIG